MRTHLHTFVTRTSICFETELAQANFKLILSFDYQEYRPLTHPSR